MEVVVFDCVFGHQDKMVKVILCCHLYPKRHLPFGHPTLAYPYTFRSQSGRDTLWCLVAHIVWRKDAFTCEFLGVPW